MSAPSFLYSQAPVLIVGAGSSGLAAALELNRHGQAVRIVDKAAAPNTESRGTGLQARTLEMLSLYGVSEQIVDRGNRLKALSFFLDGQPVGKVDFSQNSSRFNLSPALPQAITEGILRDRLAAVGVKVTWGLELVSLRQCEEGVTARFRDADGQETDIRAPWLVACDGSRSTARNLLGLAFDGKSFPEGWALMDAKVDWALPPDEVRSWRRSSGGQFIAVPLGQGVWRLQIDSRDPERDTGPPTTEEMQAALESATGLTARISEPTWRSNFRVGCRQVTDYRVGRVLLGGDAAHVHTPAGGQGLNMGIQDGINLGWKLALVAQGNADVSLIDSYQAERKPVAASILQLTEVLARRPDSMVANNNMPPRVRADIVGQLTHGYQTGPLAQTLGDADPASSRSGQRVDDQVLGDIGLYERLGRHGLIAVLVGEGGAWQQAAEQLRRRWPGLLTVWDLSATAPPLDLALAQRYLGFVTGAAVMRPDAYFGLVTAASPAAAATHIDAYLESVLRLRKPPASVSLNLN